MCMCVCGWCARAHVWVRSCVLCTRTTQRPDRDRVDCRKREGDVRRLTAPSVARQFIVSSARVPPVGDVVVSSAHVRRSATSTSRQRLRLRVTIWVPSRLDRGSHRYQSVSVSISTAIHIYSHRPGGTGPAPLPQSSSLTQLVSSGEDKLPQGREEDRRLVDHGRVVKRLLKTQQAYWYYSGIIVVVW